MNPSSFLLPVITIRRIQVDLSYVVLNLGELTYCVSRRRRWSPKFKYQEPLLSLICLYARFCSVRKLLDWILVLPWPFGLGILLSRARIYDRFVARHKQWHLQFTVTLPNGPIVGWGIFLRVWGLLPSFRAWFQYTQRQAVRKECIFRLYTFQRVKEPCKFWNPAMKCYASLISEPPCKKIFPLGVVIMIQKFAFRNYFRDALNLPSE